MMQTYCYFLCGLLNSKAEVFRKCIIILLVPEPCIEKLLFLTDPFRRNFLRFYQISNPAYMDS